MSKQQSRNLYDQILKQDKSQQCLKKETDDPLMDKDTIDDKFGSNFSYNVRQYQSQYVSKNNLEKYVDNTQNLYHSESPSAHCSTSQFANTDNTDN